MNIPRGGGARRMWQLCGTRLGSRRNSASSVLNCYLSALYYAVFISVRNQFLFRSIGEKYSGQNPL